MSMQVIEKRVWCFQVSPGPLPGLELSDLEDDTEDEDLNEDEEDLTEDLDDLNEDDMEELDSEDDADFEVRLVVDRHTTIDRVLELFNASRAALGVGPNDTVVGLSVESSVSQVSASITH